MSAQDRAIQKLAKELAGIKREVTSWRGPQADYTSIENGGNFTFKDGDGNVTAVVGGQDDGSNTIRHVDGPTPPVPSGLSAHVDGPIVQVSWDGTFESDVTHDWHYLEVLAVGPNNEQLTGTINDLSGGETSLAATSQGDWFITARSVSRAGKRSLDGDAGTVAVQLVGLTGAIDAVQASADGKSTIYYSPTPPDAPEGGFNNGDLWFDTSEEGNNQASVWDGNGWVSMEDARLATIIDAQEALESDLQDVQTSVDGKNKITYDPALPPASYVGAVGDTWYRTSGNSMIGFWKWDGAAWVQQALSTTVIPQIDIGAGTFGSLKGARLEAGSVTADRLVVGISQNLVVDSKFKNAQINAARTAGGTWEAVNSGSETWFRNKWGVSLSKKFFYLTTDGQPGNQVTRIAVDPNSVWHMSVEVNTDGQSITDLAASCIAYDGFGTPLYLAKPFVRADTGGRTVNPGDGWVRFEATFNWNDYDGIVTVAPRVYVNLATTGGWSWFRNPFVGEKTGTTLIESGAITTEKLAVGAITAESGVIASLDLGTATVGELDGARIMGQTIHGEQLSGDAIDGKVITGPTIQSARDGQRWVGDTSGIRIFNADNEVRTQLSPDGSVFKGEVEADTLVVNGGAEFKANNALAQGASLLLAAGVTDPTAPPTVQPFWDGLEFDNPAGVTGKVGLAFDGTNYWTANQDGLSSAFNFVRIDATTGASTTFSSPVGPAGGEWFGVTCIGTELFWFYRKRYQAFVLVTDLNCVQKREWEYPGLGHTSTNPLTYRPGIGNDGTNIVIAQCSDAGSFGYNVINKTTGDLISYTSADDNTASDITGVYVGSADWGGEFVAVAKESSNTLQVFSKAGAYQASKRWSAASPESTGVVFNDGKFRTLDPSGMIHEYADVTTGDNSSDWWAAYRWYTDVNDDDIIGSTDYTSRISPGARFTWPSRAMVRVIGQPLPDGAGSLGPYLAKKSTVPVRTDYHAPSWWPTVGRPVAEWRALSTDWGTKPVPGDTNTYPEGTSSVLESASGTFQLQGDGSGYWGPLKMGRNGVMSGLVVSGEALVTPSAANTPTKFTVTLPPGRFAKPPIVWVQLSTAIPHLVQVGCYQPDTPNTFDLYMTRYNTTTTGVTWFAMDRA